MSDLLKEYLDRAYIVGNTALMLGKDDCDERLDSIYREVMANLINPYMARRVHHRSDRIFGTVTEIEHQSPVEYDDETYDEVIVFTYREPRVVVLAFDSADDLERAEALLEDMIEGCRNRLAERVADG